MKKLIASIKKMNRDDIRFALWFVVFLVVAFFILMGTFNVVVVKCLAVIGAFFLMLIIKN